MLVGAPTAVPGGCTHAHRIRGHVFDARWCTGGGARRGAHLAEGRDAAIASKVDPDPYTNADRSRDGKRGVQGGKRGERNG
jgi:hypothetical protein